MQKPLSLSLSSFLLPYSPLLRPYKTNLLSGRSSCFPPPRSVALFSLGEGGIKNDSNSKEGASLSFSLFSAVALRSETPGRPTHCLTHSSPRQGRVSRTLKSIRTYTYVLLEHLLSRGKSLRPQWVFNTILNIFLTASKQANRPPKLQSTYSTYDVFCAIFQHYSSIISLFWHFLVHAYVSIFLRARPMSVRFKGQSYVYSEFYFCICEECTRGQVSGCFALGTRPSQLRPPLPSGFFSPLE